MKPVEIRRHLTTAKTGRRLYYYPQTTSTNDVALELARHGEAEGTVVYADFQTEGRGRGGHRWLSPRGCDLLFSVVLRPEGDTRSHLPLGLALATGIAGYLRKLTGADIVLKWPNDILSGVGKICGILAEGASVSGNTLYTVVGAGINVNSDFEGLPDELAGSTTSCRLLTGKVFDRAPLLAGVLEAIERYGSIFRQGGFEPLVEEYRRSCALTGKSVRVDCGGRLVEGRVEGVQPDGTLRILPADGSNPMYLFGETLEVIS